MLANFLIAATLSLLAVLILLLRPLLRGQGSSASASHAAANVAVYRDQLAELERDHRAGNLSDNDFTQASTELQQRLVSEVPAQGEAAPRQERRAIVLAVALALALPLAAGLLYFTLGNPAALRPAAPEASAANGDVNQMVNQLAARLRQHPDDPRGWAMLAKAYKELQRYDESEQAFRHIGPMLDTDADMLAEHADLLAMVSKGTLEGEVRKEFEKALSINPDQPMALMLAGTAAYRKQDFPQAIAYWKRLQKQIPADSENAHVLHDAIALAENGGKPILSAQQVTGKTLTGQVSLSPDLANNVTATDTVFIYAQAIDGPRVPLAVLRERVSDLPITFTLDDSLAMTPQLTLSKASRVRVIARISHSGEASPQAGDLVGETGPVEPGATNLSIIIKTVFQP